MINSSGKRQQGFPFTLRLGKVNACSARVEARLGAADDADDAGARHDSKPGVQIDGDGVLQLCQRLRRRELVGADKEVLVRRIRVGIDRTVCAACKLVLARLRDYSSQY